MNPLELARPVRFDADRGYILDANDRIVCFARGAAPQAWYPEIVAALNARPNPDALAQQIACVAREIALRTRVYPKFVASGRMKQETADKELAAMTTVIETLKRLRSP